MKNISLILLLILSVSAKPKYRAGFFLIEDQMNFIMSISQRTDLKDVKKKFHNSLFSDTASYKIYQNKIDSINMIFFKLRANNDPDTIKIKNILDSLWSVYDSLFEKNMNSAKTRQAERMEKTKQLYIKIINKKAEDLDLDLIYEKSSGKIVFIKDGKQPEMFTNNNTYTIDITEEFKNIIEKLYKSEIQSND